MKEMVGGCCVCSDEHGWPDNPLVYCDGNGCTVAVHQACYGIVTVPTGPWYCKKCESPDTKGKGKIKCELCPSRSGALKPTDTAGWAHVVCALYIPEVRFENVTSMEPIVLRLIPPERYSKTCYICQDAGKTYRATAGACMQCNKSGCKQQFHVTCAQSLGLLCEEAGNYLDNVKYCGYCQHHYSKLKKGGNVKTIPPYKPVSYDSHSSDSCGEKEGEGSSAGGGNPSTMAKNKGPGRKSSHSSGGASGKSSSSSSKTPTGSQHSQHSATDPQEAHEPPPPTRRHKSSDKRSDKSDKKKHSPARRGSSAGDGGSGSKGSTPAPSPQHTPADTPARASGGGLTPSRSSKTPPAASPSNRAPEPVGVISSAPSSVVTASVVHTSASKPAHYQESVITNTEAVETKQTKKRKAASAANTPVPIDYAATPPPLPMETNQGGGTWEVTHCTAEHQDGYDKMPKKAKTESSEPMMSSHHYSMPSPAPPLPPPAHSPASQPSPRHLPSPMPGPSGLYSAVNMRSPSHLPPPPPPQKKKRKDHCTSLIVSIGLDCLRVLNCPTIFKIPQAPPDAPMPLPHIYQHPKQATADPGVPSHSPHAIPGRSTWGGLNVCYEMQSDPNKPGVSGMGASNKDMTIQPTTIRNKKRAAMTAMLNAPKPPPPMPSPVQTQPQSLASVRRQPQPTPPPIYQETIKDSPPSSPSSERPLKPKMDTKIISCGPAPHMLGNELNPDSGVAARLQEQLTAELAAHAAGTPAHDAMHPPPLLNKSLSGSSRSSSSSGAQSLDQLLERQWEQGSHFLMEQAQHFDIASLLSCLHQLRTENVRLEEHVGSLLQRRDHLLAVNARLAIPLNAVVTGQPEPGRCNRDNGPQVRTPTSVRTAETLTGERSHQLMMREVQQKPS